MDENRAMCHQKRSLESLSLHVGELKTITARVITLRGVTWKLITPNLRLL